MSASRYRPVPAPGGWRWERIPRRPIWPAWSPPRLTPRGTARHFAPLIAITLGVVALAGVCLWGVFAG